MAAEKRSIPVNENLEEQCEHGTTGFPMLVSEDDLLSFESLGISCHWHDDLEIGMVRQGKVHYQVGGQSCYLTEGQAVLVNSDVPHSAYPMENLHCIVDTFIIRPVFLQDGPDSDINRNCMQPFLHNMEIPCVFLSGEKNWECQALENLSRVAKLYRKKTPFFEMKIKSLMLDFFYLIFRENQENLKHFTDFNQENLRKLRVMLEYLHEHYEEPLSLQKLSTKVLLSREACCRFFKHMTGNTISQYLKEYRISKSLQLLSDGRYSVAEISEMCGFSSAGRYAQAFREKMNVSPRQYLYEKKQNKAGNYPEELL